MNDLRVGSRVRAVRLRLGWRQSDLAGRAGVSQPIVSRVERGSLDRLSLRTLRRVLAALEIDLELVPRWRAGDLDRLADEDHAHLVGLVTALLVALGWEVRAEVSYSVYGERGSIDLLAWHPGSRTLLVVEVKSSLTSVEETLRRHDVKVRLASSIARERFGWDARAVGRLIALPEDMTARRRVARHAAVFDPTYPLRGHAAKAWLRSPVGSSGLILFLSDMPGATTRAGRRPIRRVRRRRSQPSARTNAPQF
jgi:transcriptional regulator with XRE-family HTH domain